MTTTPSPWRAKTRVRETERRILPRRTRPTPTESSRRQTEETRLKTRTTHSTTTSRTMKTHDWARTPRPRRPRWFQKRVRVLRVPCRARARSVSQTNPKHTRVDAHLPGHVRVLINSRTHVRRGSPVSASRVVSHLVRVVVENAQRLASKFSASVEFSSRGVCSVGIAGVFRRWVVDACYSFFLSRWFTRVRDVRIDARA